MPRLPALGMARQLYCLYFNPLRVDFLAFPPFDVPFGGFVASQDRGLGVVFEHPHHRIFDPCT